MEFEYTEITPSEIHDVAKLHIELSYHLQRTIEDDYWDFEQLSEDKIQKHLETFIENPERKIFVAKARDTIVGFITAEIIKCHLPISNTKNVGYISAAYVVPDYRMLKIMSNLEKLAVRFFKERKLKYVELNYLSENLIAKNAWESFGYKTFRVQARKKI